MSLAPQEQQALRHIEERLRESDPELATKLERGGLHRIPGPQPPGGWRQHRLTWVLLVAAAAMLMAVWVITLTAAH